MLTTDRLTVRPPVEADRARFVELFANEDFMAFSNPLGPNDANSRFDMMVTTASVSYTHLTLPTTPYV